MPLFAPAALLAVTTALCMVPASAGDWGLCSVPVIHKTEKKPAGQSTTEITADSILSEDRRILRFSGDVEMQRGDQRIRADYLQYTENPEHILARGNLHYADSLFDLKARQLEFNNQMNSGFFHQAEFQLYENHLRGEAAHIEQIDPDRRLLRNVTYTTCDPQDDHWSLSASRLELDQASGMGTARHSVLRLGRLPVFYFPWFRFPITDERITGLLPPTLSHSENHGFMLAVPFYWNQAMNYDMTITPLWYDKRGLQLNTENRYLFDRHAGQLRLSWLDDDSRDDQRWYRQWRHHASLGSQVQADILLQKVSDEDILDDFNQLQDLEYVDYLNSSMRFSSLLGGWNSALLLEQYQTINQSTAAADRPYKRLPRVTMQRNFQRDDGASWLTWKNELVQFEREQSITGQRLHISPQLSYPLEGDYYFLQPSLQIDLTEYRLDNNSNDINEISRALPLLSLDSGLYFERLAGSSKNWLQTLEPRLFLLYVPYEDQDDIPDFDSALKAESYHGLFTNNRFSGADRIGDSQQLSLGLTSRLLNLFGREVASISLGQAWYGKARRVSLDNSVDDSDESSLITLISLRPDDYWQVQLGAVYDRQERETRQTDIAFRRHQGQHVLNLEYHFREDSLEQSTLSLVYPHSQRLSFFAKQQHSIRHDKPVQNLLGLRYDSCCWRFEMLYEEETDKDFIDTDRSVYFQLTFKGLGSAGNDISSMLEDGILGYNTAD